MPLTTQQTKDLAKLAEIDDFCTEEPCAECEYKIQQLTKFAELVLQCGTKLPEEKLDDGV